MKNKASNKSLNKARRKARVGVANADRAGKRKNPVADPDWVAPVPGEPKWVKFLRTYRIPEGVVKKKKKGRLRDELVGYLVVDESSGRRSIVWMKTLDWRRTPAGQRTKVYPLGTLVDRKGVVHERKVKEVVGSKSSVLIGGPGYKWSERDRG